MEHTTIIVAERSAKRDLFFFMFGAWSMILLRFMIILRIFF